MKLDTAGLGKDVKLELVVYKEQDGKTMFHMAEPFEQVGQQGDIVTYKINYPVHENGIFRYAFRAYPWNENLPHRQDFAYLKWF